jgi:hypothetical protein
MIRASCLSDWCVCDVGEETRHRLVNTTDNGVVSMTSFPSRSDVLRPSETSLQARCTCNKKPRRLGCERLGLRSPIQSPRSCLRDRIFEIRCVGLPACVHVTVATRVVVCIGVVRVPFMSSASTASSRTRASRPPISDLISEILSPR